MIPVVIVHFGNQEYLHKVIEITSKKNKIILIGDDTNQGIPNVQHIHYKDLMTEDIIELAQSFYNFKENTGIQVLPDLTCVNYGKYEFMCFARIFFLRELMKREKIPWVFHIDSDCILLEDVNEIDFLRQDRVVLSKPFLTNELDMVASIHNSLLNVEFCEKIIELVTTVFIDRKISYDLVEKMIWHITNQIPGNICDMTFYYMLCKKDVLKTLNTTSLFNHKGDLSTFDHCIHLSVGATHADMYVMENGIKKLEKDGEKIIASTTNGAKVQMLSLHFNAHTKDLIKNFFNSS
jgi:hypothetical protein